MRDIFVWEPIEMASCKKYVSPSQLKELHGRNTCEEAIPKISSEKYLFRGQMRYLHVRYNCVGIS